VELLLVNRGGDLAFVALRLAEGYGGSAGRVPAAAAQV
jgi:hypothetical protein